MNRVDPSFAARQFDTTARPAVVLAAASRTAAYAADILFVGLPRPVDDALCEALRANGHAIETADAADAVSRVLQGNFGVVILDHAPPLHDALDTLDRLRRHLTIDDQPIALVFQPGMDKEELERTGAHALTLGASDCLDADTDIRLAVARIGSQAMLGYVTGAAQEAESRLSLAIEGANDGIWDWSLQSNELRLSDRWHDIVGLHGSGGSVVPDFWLDRVHEDDRQGVLRDLRSSLDGLSDHFLSEHRVRHENGTYRWVLVRGVVARGNNGEAERIAGSMTDITDRKAIDRLTGLPNRGPLSERIDRTLARLKQHESGTAALFVINIDGVGIINEGYGERIGNAVLKAIAWRLTNTLRPTDVVASFGGDEFGIFIDRIDDPADSLRIGKRIQDVIAETIECEDRMINLTSGIGVVVSTNRHVHGTDMISEAYTSLKRAKRSGKGGIALFDEKMQMSAARRLDTERELRIAIDRGEVQLAYQPIFDLETGDLTGFESLARWLHPERGMISPGEFIPVAEESGLIVPMTAALFEIAMERAAYWSRTYAADRPFYISVNLSARNLETPTLVAEIDDTLQRHGVPASILKIEVTESQMMKDFDLARQRLEQFREAGIRIALDDFGTGYSSLSYLTQLPFDTLKIDRSFIAGSDKSAEKQKVLHAIVALGHSLDMMVVGEGVETTGEHDIVRSLDIDTCQGYLYGRPALPDDLEPLLTRWKVDLKTLCT